jgi:2'-5' RNA ligase
MRLFIAVELPPSVAAAAAAASEALRERVRQRAPHARLAWVAADRMHLTVRFLGEMNPDRVRAIAQALAAPLDDYPFPLTLGAAGAFPLRGAPRALWLAINEGRSALSAVEEAVSSRLDTLAVGRESRAFKPHLTLARVRDPSGLQRGEWLQGLVPPPHAPGVVDAITLFESRLSSTGPTYTVLQRTSLRPG